MIEIETLKPILEKKLLSSHINSRVLLNRLRVISESSRDTSAYNDDRYAPFYYHLGNEITPKSMVELGFRLGLLSSCFLMGCKTVTNFLAFQQSSQEFYSPRLGKSNVKDHYRGSFNFHLGKILDPSFTQVFSSQKWDLILINEEMSYDMHMAYLDAAWANLSNDGIITMDYVNSCDFAKEAYYNFCKVANRNPLIIKTRYGVGLIQK